MAINLNPHAKAHRDIWATSRISSDISFSFYGLWVYICGWGFLNLLHNTVVISTRCAEKSAKSSVLKGFQYCTFLWWKLVRKQQQKTSLTSNKMANSLQVTKKKNVKEKKLFFFLVTKYWLFQIQHFSVMFCVCLFFLNWQDPVKQSYLLSRLGGTQAFSSKYCFILLYVSNRAKAESLQKEAMKQRRTTLMDFPRSLQVPDNGSQEGKIWLF